MPDGRFGLGMTAAAVALPQLDRRGTSGLHDRRPDETPTASLNLDAPRPRWQRPDPRESVAQRLQVLHPAGCWSRRASELDRVAAAIVDELGGVHVDEAAALQLHRALLARHLDHELGHRVTVLDEQHMTPSGE